jgi:hypothetical protein
MAIPSLPDADIKADEALDEAVMKTGLRDRDDYLWSTAPNGGTGIEPNVTALASAFGTAGHSHDGTDGQGVNIDTAGIANGAASLEPMFQDNCVSAAKIAANTLQGSDFAAMAVTGDKMSGTMGTHVTGSVTYDSLAAPGAGDVTFLGDRTTTGNGKGSPGVVCNQAPTASGFVDYYVIRQTGGNIVLGFDFTGPAGYAASGTWDYDLWIV